MGVLMWLFVLGVVAVAGIGAVYVMVLAVAILYALARVLWFIVFPRRSANLGPKSAVTFEGKLASFRAGRR